MLMRRRLWIVFELVCEELRRGRFSEESCNSMLIFLHSLENQMDL